MTLTEAFSKAVSMPIRSYPNLRLINKETKSYFLIATHNGKIALYRLSQHITEHDLFSNAWEVENESEVKE